jgi:hypothetical protein
MNNFVSQDMLKTILENACWDGEVKKAKVVTEGKAEEKVEEHTCPLCESKLDEEISEEKLTEHFDAVLALAESVLEENSENEETMDEESLTEDELLEAIEEMSDEEFESYVESLSEEEFEALTELLEEKDEDDDDDEDDEDEDDEEDKD